jgi:hypothetical protein
VPAPEAYGGLLPAQGAPRGGGGGCGHRKRWGSGRVARSTRSRVERTRRTAGRPGSSSLRTIRSCSHFPSRSVVRVGRLAAGEHPAARATIPPRQQQAFHAAGCSARRLAAGHAQRGQQRRLALHRRNVPRLHWCRRGTRAQMPGRFRRAKARRKGCSLQEVAAAVLRISQHMGLNSEGVQP